jgi:hypothetical protein
LRAGGFSGWLESVLIAASTFVWVFILVPLGVVCVGLVYLRFHKPTGEDARRQQAASADLRRGHGQSGTRPPPPVD